MSDMFKMMKQAMAMQREVKQIQKELARKLVEFTVSGVTVKARGDMTIDSVTVAPTAMDPLRPDRLEKMLVTAINGALSAAKKEAGSEMAKRTSGLGLPGMFGQ